MNFPPEMEPLEGIQRFLPPGYRQLPARQSSYSAASRTCFKGPLRAIRLLLFITVIPAMFILIPIYMRYRIFPGQMYPVGMTDMRLIDNKISTTWCQKQIVKSDAMFNAFLVKEQPTISSDLIPVTMTRYLYLDDDMKEYWGFYLLKGSIVTVSTCVRRPGASIILIRGYKHLKDCAYIGDDSSEELEELIRADEMHLLDPETHRRLIELKTEREVNKTPAVRPEEMQRANVHVDFHDKTKTSSKRSEINAYLVYNETAAPPNGDITDHDPKELQALLNRLREQREKKKHIFGPPDNIVTLASQHRHRDPNVDRDAQKDLHFQDLDGKGVSLPPEVDESLKQRRNDHKTSSKEVFAVKTETGYHLKDVNPYFHPRKGLIELKEKMKDDAEVKDEIGMVDNEVEIKDKKDLEDTKGDRSAVNSEAKSDEKQDGADLETTGNRSNNTDKDAPSTSNEILEEFYHKLDSLGDRGKRILERLNMKMQIHHNISTQTNLNDLDEEESEKRLDELVSIVNEAVDEERRKGERREARRKANEAGRMRRQAMIEEAKMTKDFNEDDEKGNAAIEEDMEPDGFAEEHKVVNETTPLDFSNSEFWSSFSSSEEALLNCEGLLLNLALTPHPLCEVNGTDGEHETAAHTNSFSYKVPANGYYFFVLSSENEVQTNFIRVKFDLQKTFYEVAQKTLAECRNYTQKCYLPLDFFSGEKVVLELPLRDNDSLWNEAFVVYSECEPRTSIYVLCVIAVPLIILLFAFQ